MAFPLIMPGAEAKGFISTFWHPRGLWDSILLLYHTLPGVGMKECEGSSSWKPILHPIKLLSISRE